MTGRPKVSRLLGALTGDPDERWDTCTACQHYRLEHTGRGGSCLTLKSSIDNPDEPDRCDCRKFRGRS